MMFDAQKQIAPTELGARLAIARRNRNLSQEEVASKLGVSRPTYISIEKGSRTIKPAELDLLSNLFSRSVHELVSQREFIADFAPQFRITQSSEVSMEAVTSSVNKFQRACEDYLTLETLVEAPMPRYSYPEPYSHGALSQSAAAEEAATLERSRLNLGLGPISNLFEVLENEAGLRVFALPLSDFKIAGMFVYTDRLGGCILVNGQHPTTRQVWTLAHEYAHFVSDRFKDELTILIEYERRPRSEQFADAFAANFLMPSSGLRRRFLRIFQSRKDFTVADLCLLADQYGVSVEAMTRRLEGMTCIRKGAWEELAAEGFRSSRLRTHLSLGARQVVRHRFPDRYLRLAIQAFENELITESELMRVLHCSRVEARETVDALTQSTEVAQSGKMYQLDLNFGDTLGLASEERVA